MTLVRTVLACAVLGASMSTFAAMPDSADPDPAGREARMEEALQHFHAKQDATTQAAPQAKPSHHAKHQRHAKHMSAKSKDAKDAKDDSGKAKDQAQTQ